MGELVEFPRTPRFFATDHSSSVQFPCRESRACYQRSQENAGDTGERINLCGVDLRMGRQLKEQWQEFRRRLPGERFQDSYRRSKQKNDKTMRLWRLLRVLGAVVMIVLGVIFSLVPGIPGVVFFFFAATILAAESLRFARMLDAGEVKLRGTVAGIKRWRSGRRAAGRHS